MNTVYFNLSELAAAAQAQDCSVHLHLDTQGKPVFSIGSENLGAAEFDSYEEALEYVSDRNTLDAGDFAEQAGAEIGNNLLNAMLAAESQGQRVALIQSAILNVATLEHHDRGTAGFAMMLVNVLEIGLQHAPRGEQ